MVKLTADGDNRVMESLYRRQRFPPEISSDAARPGAPIGTTMKRVDGRRLAGPWGCVVLGLALSAFTTAASAERSAASGAVAGEPKKAPGAEAEGATAEASPAASGGLGSAGPGAAAADDSAGREELNLLGQTDAESGESRRNENVRINLIDNNVLKELNQRIGASATIVESFEVDKEYFGTVYGGSPLTPPHVSAAPGTGVHGRLYYGHNNSIFSARSFFQAGSVAPARENEYGFSVGLPSWKGGFLTLDGSQQKIRGSVNGNVLTPSLGERTPLATDPARRAIVASILAAYPAELPNRTDIDPRALNLNAPQLIDNDSAGIQLDQAAGAGNRLLFRYRFTAQGVEAFQLVAGQNPDTRTKSHDARVTWFRERGEAVTRVSARFGRVGSLLTPDQSWAGPLISAGSAISRLGSGGSIPTDRALNDFTYAAQRQQTQGRHQLTFGAELNRQQVNGLKSNSHRGLLTFRNDLGVSAITNLRFGRPTMFSQSIGNVHRGFRNWRSVFYAGDRWKARQNLTLSIGLHFAAVTAPIEVNELTPPPYSCDCNNLSPRFGFAYRLGGAKGVVRGAYGIHYREIFPVTFGLNRFNPPLNRRLSIQAPDLVDPLAGIDVNNFAPETRTIVYLLSPDLSTPYTHNYNFSWELEPARGWKLSLGYAGARSHQLIATWPQNRSSPVDGIPLTTATIDLRRADESALEMKRFLNGSRAYFDAAKVTLTIPRWRGLSLESSYWLSKAIDLGGDYTTSGGESGAAGAEPQWQYEAHRDLKAVSPFDQRHALLTRVVYETPALSGAPSWARRMLGRWNVSAVVLLKGGTPFTVRSGSDAPGRGNVDGSTSDRPNLLDLSVLGRSIDNPDTSVESLPASAFGFVALGERAGSLGRNTFRKDGIRNVNAALSRRWSLRGDTVLELRAESINLFNTPQFAEPGRSLADPNFGRITNTLNDGRTFRFRLQLEF